MTKIKRIIVCFVLIFSVLISVGCSSTNKVRASVDQVFVTLMDGNFNQATKYLYNSNLNDAFSDVDLTTFEQIFMATYHNLDYKVIETKEQDDSNATVKISIKASDMTQAFNDFLTDYMNYTIGAMLKKPVPSNQEMNKKFDELLINRLTSNELPIVTKEIMMDCKKVDGEWKLVASDDFYNAISGGLYSKVMDFRKANQ